MADDNNEQAQPNVDQVSDIQDQQKTADAARKAADVTTNEVATDHRVSIVEHSMGGRQPDDGSYDALRANAPLEGRDIPQKIIVANNDTPTPGETNKVPTGDHVVNRSEDQF